MRCLYQTIIKVSERKRRQGERINYKTNGFFFINNLSQRTSFTTKNKNKRNIETISCSKSNSAPERASCTVWKYLWVLFSGWQNCGTLKLIRHRISFMNWLVGKASWIPHYFLNDTDGPKLCRTFWMNDQICLFDTFDRTNKKYINHFF